MQTKTKLLGMLIAVVALLQAASVSAFDNPDEDDIFWQTLSTMDNPNDVEGCRAKIDELWNASELGRIDVERIEAAGEVIANREEEINSRDEAKRISLTSGYYNSCAGLDEGFEIMRSSMEQYGKTSNIWDMADWHNVNGLYFESQGEGKIYFERTIDFMSYRFQIFMQELPKLMMFDKGYISLNAEMVPELKNYGAVLTMYNLSFSQAPDIYVNGVKANSNDLGVVYDASAGTLTFNASHFSSYRAVQKGTKVKKMKMGKLTKKSKNITYNANKSTFKIKTTGNNLKSKGKTTVCTLGYYESISAKPSKNGKSIVCTFNMDDFSQTGYYPLSISIYGLVEVSKQNAVRIN